MTDGCNRSSFILLAFHPFSAYHYNMLEAGDIFEFDQIAPFLSATKNIPSEAWQALGRKTTDPWQGREVLQVMSELRGPGAMPRNP